MLEMEDPAAFTTGSVPRAKQRFQETWKDSVHAVSYSAFTPQVLPESTKVLFTAWNTVEQTVTSTYSSPSSKWNMSVTMRLTRLKLTKASFLALSSFSYMNMKMFLQVFFSLKQIKNIYFNGL